MVHEKLCIILRKDETKSVTFRVYMTSIYSLKILFFSGEIEITVYPGLHVSIMISEERIKDLVVFNVL